MAYGMKPHKVTINMDAGGIGTVSIDGVDVPNVVRVSFDAQPMRPSEVHITLYGMDVEIQAETGEIQFKRE